MRRANFLVVVLSGLVLSGLVRGEVPALAADSGPVIVIPGRHGLPVIINGVDVSGAVLEGDWGLYSPHMVGPTIIPAPWIPGQRYPGSYYQGRDLEGGYYPAFGHEPGYGRHEIEPPADRQLPPPAPRFHRSWSTHSDPVPASLDPPLQSPLVVAPQIYPDGRRGNGPQPKRR